MHEARYRTIRHNPRSLHTVRRVAPISGEHRDIADPHFAQTVLATFIGPEPPTPRLKRELLGGRD